MPQDYPPGTVEDFQQHPAALLRLAGHAATCRVAGFLAIADQPVIAAQHAVAARAVFTMHAVGSRRHAPGRAGDPAVRVARNRALGLRARRLPAGGTGLRARARDSNPALHDLRREAPGRRSA